jgi:hypothetical protein
MMYAMKESIELFLDYQNKMKGAQFTSRQGEECQLHTSL